MTDKHLQHTHTQPGAVPRAPGLRRWARWACGLYATALTISTHLPATSLPPLHTSDKVLHFVAYLGLAGLAGLAAWLGRRPSMGAVLTMAAALALFGALDELLQIPVGRDGSVADWLADCAGAAVGLACAWGLAALTDRGEPPGAGAATAPDDARQ